MTPGIERKGDERNKKELRLLAALLFAVYIVVVALVAWMCSYSIRTSVRWRAFSQHYKHQVLEQPKVGREFQHIEWDGWGWAGMDTNVYLVFDPTDSLSTAARTRRPGKFDGIPCEVPVVDPIEKNWYLVQFYTNEFWGRKNALNCTGSAD